MVELAAALASSLKFMPSMVLCISCSIASICAVKFVCQSATAAAAVSLAACTSPTVLARAATASVLPLLIASAMLAASPAASSLPDCA